MRRTYSIELIRDDHNDESEQGSVTWSLVVDRKAAVSIGTTKVVTPESALMLLLNRAA